MIRKRLAAGIRAAVLAAVLGAVMGGTAMAAGMAENDRDLVTGPGAQNQTEEHEHRLSRILPMK